ncbi:hypothetical protein K435DRAFT_587392, partial [Dendrothele bispora CBS 962.96]
MEIGSPMAAMYLLGNPDHYTNSDFTNFYWVQYVDRVRTYWKDVDNVLSLQSDLPLAEQDIPDEKVWVNKNKDQYVGISNVDDYALRNEILADMNLYDFMTTYRKERRSKKK